MLGFCGDRWTNAREPKGGAKDNEEEPNTLMGATRAGPRETSVVPLTEKEEVFLLLLLLLLLLPPGTAEPLLDPAGEPARERERERHLDLDLDCDRE